MVLEAEPQLDLDLDSKQGKAGKGRRSRGGRGGAPAGRGRGRGRSNAAIEPEGPSEGDRPRAGTPDRLSSNVFQYIQALRSFGVGILLL
eukprot:12156126-Alexandrium_andersonii.AAC.1